MTTLLHAIYATHQLPDPGLLAVLLESLWLLHVEVFIVRQNTMKEGSIDVQLLNLPSHGCGNVQKHPEGLHLHCRGGGSIIVYTIYLLEALRAPTGLEPDRLSLLVTLQLKSGLTL